MFNYDIDIVVNSNEYLTPSYNSASGVLNLYDMKYKKDDIKSVFKRDYTAPVNGGIQFPVNSTKWDADSYYQIRIEVVATEYYQDGSFIGREQGYGKPFIVEFRTPSSGSATYQTDLENIIKEEFNSRPDIWKLNSGAVTGSAPNELIHFQFVNEYFLIKVGTISKLNEDTLRWKEVGSISTSTKSDMIQVSGFGTYDFILRNLRVPTYESLRFYAIDRISRPITSNTYTQYTIVLESKRSISGDQLVGEDVVSNTRHIYYVDNSKKTVFESMFDAGNANISITTI